MSCWEMPGGRLDKPRWRIYVLITDALICTAQDILSKMPAEYDMEAVQATYPTTYRESMNTVLAQECIRYNSLLAVMAASLRETVKALKGLVVMSPELEAVAYR